MACPKVNPRYPDTAGHPPALPIGVLCRRADPNFDKARRFDVAYEFGRSKRFTEDALFHGAYTAPPALANDPSLTYGLQDGPDLSGGPFSSGFSQGFEAPNGLSRADVIAALDAQLRLDNGFCDPFDDGTVQTGTGAGGRNPGTVPSLSALITPDGFVIATADDRALDALLGVGAVFYGSGTERLYLSDAGNDAGDDAVVSLQFTDAGDDASSDAILPASYVRLPSGLAVD